MSTRIDIKAVAAPKRSTALLMKTNQTVSYRTGDDGDVEAGRDVSFLVLAENNIFGNTNRFTDTVGGQTYANNIIIDHSTYDGSKVFGWYKLSSPLLYTWNQAIDWAVALSVGGFTSGWRLPNINQLMSILNWGISSNLNYAPFSLATQISHWTSTTNPNDTTSALIVISNSVNPVINYAKANSRNTYYAGRTFTVTGTTLS